MTKAQGEWTDAEWNETTGTLKRQLIYQTHQSKFCLFLEKMIIYFTWVWTISEHTWVGRNLASTCRPRDPGRRDVPCTWATLRDWRLLLHCLSVDLPSDPEHNTPRTPHSAEIIRHVGKSTEGNWRNFGYRSLQFMGWRTSWVELSAWTNSFVSSASALANIHFKRARKKKNF